MNKITKCLRQFCPKNNSNLQESRISDKLEQSYNTVINERTQYMSENSKRETDRNYSELPDDKLRNELDKYNDQELLAWANFNLNRLEDNINGKCVDSDLFITLSQQESIIHRLMQLDIESIARTKSPLPFSDFLWKIPTNVQDCKKYLLKCLSDSNEYQRDSEKNNVTEVLFQVLSGVKFLEHTEFASSVMRCCAENPNDKNLFLKFDIGYISNQHPVRISDIMANGISRIGQKDFKDIYFYQVDKKIYLFLFSRQYADSNSIIEALPVDKIFKMVSFDGNTTMNINEEILSEATSEKPMQKTIAYKDHEIIVLKMKAFHKVKNTATTNFVQERILSKKIQNSFVPFIQIELNNEIYYIERNAGMDLCKAIKIGESVTINMLKPVVKSLALLNELGIVLLDIKLNNLVVDAEKVVRLIDYDTSYMPDAKELKNGIISFLDTYYFNTTKLCSPQITEQLIIKLGLYFRQHNFTNINIIQNLRSIYSILQFLPQLIMFVLIDNKLVEYNEIINFAKSEKPCAEIFSKEIQYVTDKGKDYIKQFVSTYIKEEFREFISEFGIKFFDARQNQLAQSTLLNMIVPIVDHEPQNFIVEFCNLLFNGSVDRTVINQLSIIDFNLNLMMNWPKTNEDADKKSSSEANLKKRSLFFL